jgi:hypothetical protein
MAFRAKILINSVDYYDQLTGEVSVSIDEGQARIAIFTLDPLPGPIDPYAWIGQPVVISYSPRINGDAFDEPYVVIFTGVVHTPDYDIDAGTTKFTCTDNLQESFETVSRAQADQLIPVGVWSDKIFRSTRDNWDYAQQKMSTYPGSLDKSPAGALRVTDWAAKSVADYTYTAANIDSGTLKIDQLAERRSIVNSVKIIYTSVFQALRQREETITWSADNVTPWSVYLSNPYTLPERQAIEAALKDWTLKSITYEDLPDSGTYGGIIWVLSDYSKSLCQGFTATVAARWRQDIVAEYTITVGNAASQAQHGLLQIDQAYNVSHKTKGRNDDFLKFDAYKTPEGNQIYGAVGGAGEWLQSTQGDDGLPQLVAVSVAKTKILASHRQNRISFECALNPGLDVDKTVAIDHPKLTAKGKVYAVEHKINVLDGFAITRCTVAVTLPSVGGQLGDAITRAAMPYAADPLDFTPPSAPPTFAPLGNYIGNIDGAPEDDPAWNGWITNYDYWAGFGTPPPVYDPIRFAVETPAVDGTDYNAWLNDTTELQTRLVKSGANYYQRVAFGNETVIAGDSVMLYDGDTLQDTHTVTAGDLDAGYYQIAALSERQDEHAVTHLITAAYNVALPVEMLEFSK